MNEPQEAPNRLREAREAAGLTQADLAARVMVTKQAISQFETGAAMPSLALALAIAQALGGTVDGLFRPSESNSPSDESLAPTAATAPSGASSARIAAKPAGKRARAGKSRRRRAA